MVQVGAVAVWFFSNTTLSVTPLTIRPENVSTLLAPLRSQLQVLWQQFFAQSAPVQVDVVLYGGRFIPWSVVETSARVYHVMKIHEDSSRGKVWSITEQVIEPAGHEPIESHPIDHITGSAAAVRAIELIITEAKGDKGAILPSLQPREFTATAMGQKIRTSTRAWSRVMHFDGSIHHGLLMASSAMESGWL